MDYSETIGSVFLDCKKSIDYDNEFSTEDRATFGLMAIAITATANTGLDNIEMPIADTVLAVIGMIAEKSENVREQVVDAITCILHILIRICDKNNNCDSVFYQNIHGLLAELEIN